MVGVLCLASPTKFGFYRCNGTYLLGLGSNDIEFEI